MSVTLCVYDVATGRILRTVTCDLLAAELQPGDGEDWIPGEASDLTHYIVGDEITPRAPIVATCAATWPADDATPLVIAGLPVGASVRWTGPEGASGDLIASAGSVSLITNAPGGYTFTVDEPAYLPLQLEATATP